MYTQIFGLHARLLKAMAHPRRLEIIHLLRDQELAVCDIHSMLDLPQANISQHLMLMREAGIVKTRRDGKSMYYSLADVRIHRASEMLREVLIDQQSDANLKDELTVKMKDLVPLVHDPVCHMRLSPKTAGFTHVHDGTTYYFCASGCIKKFKQNPGDYVNR